MNMYAVIMQHTKVAEVKEDAFQRTTVVYVCRCSNDAILCIFRICKTLMVKSYLTFGRP